MEAARAAQELALASASLTRPHDVAGSLAALLKNCKEGLAVDAVGILVESADGLELLASSSHAASELEMHQLHVEQGPCIDAFTTAESTQEHSRQALLKRWPEFARTMLASGFESVHATPLVWHGEAIGAMGVFRRVSAKFTPDEKVVARAFADIATMLVVQLDEAQPDQLSQRVKDALESRVLIELAKGVLADAHDLSMADAYELLVRGAVDSSDTLTDWATSVVEGAQRRN
jgi:transcriptional regulator with GAF, ATPase, and Fis domain